MVDWRSLERQDEETREQRMVEMLVAFCHNRQRHISN